MLWKPEHTLNTWSVKAFASVYFRNRIARAGSKLHRPGIFPFLENLLRPTWLWSLLVQGSWIANCDLVSPSFFPQSGPAYHGPTAQHDRPLPLGSSPRAPKASKVQQMMLSWVRFSHYTSRGPLWHPIQAIITSKEWYKRDFPLKAF